MGIEDEDILLVENDTIVAGKPMNGEITVPYKKCVQIYGLDIHLVDHCNLNCELCCHNSQLVEGEVLVDFDSYCKDLVRLHEIVPNIVQISLLGGEPLLHPDLIQFLDFTRKIYPYTRIAMVTNGILLRQSSQELLECFKRNKIDISISLYPPMHQQLDVLIQYARQQNICVSIHRVDRFFKKFCEEPKFDSEEMSSYCGYCMGLRNGRISRCIDSLFTGYFNAKFGDILPETEGYDIYDKSLDSLELIHALEQPMALCAYCGSKYTLVDSYEWRQADKNVEKEDILIS